MILSRHRNGASLPWLCDPHNFQLSTDPRCSTQGMTGWPWETWQGLHLSCATILAKHLAPMKSQPNPFLECRTYHLAHAAHHHLAFLSVSSTVTNTPRQNLLQTLTQQNRSHLGLYVPEKCLSPFLPLPAEFQITPESLHPQ